MLLIFPFLFCLLLYLLADFIVIVFADLNFYVLFMGIYCCGLLFFVFHWCCCLWFCHYWLCFIYFCISKTFLFVSHWWFMSKYDAFNVFSIIFTLVLSVDTAGYNMEEYRRTIPIPQITWLGGDKTWTTERRNIERRRT